MSDCRNPNCRDGMEPMMVLLDTQTGRYTTAYVLCPVCFPGGWERSRRQTLERIKRDYHEREAPK